MRKHSVVVLVLVVVTFSFSVLRAAADGTRRGFMFQFGVGAGFPTYPAGLESLFSYAASLPGAQRVKVSLDVAAGVAVSQNVYLMGRIDGLGDRVAINASFMQLNLYLFSLDVRYYPAVKGLYLEGGLGTSAGLVQTSSSGSSSSDPRFGVGGAVGKYHGSHEKYSFPGLIRRRARSIPREG